jgi:trehalose 6-phosphate phosphatase
MNERLFDAQQVLEERIASASHVLLCLDFDGTLASFVANPIGASLSQQMERALKALADRDGISLAIISGRERADLQAHVNINGLIFAGNHGLEISGPGFLFVEPSAVAKSAELQHMTDLLRTSLREIPGVQVEDKGLTASVHYRNTPPDHWDEVKRLVHSVLASADHPFLVSPGEKIFEIRPRVNWHKGSAVARILEHLNQPDALVIYVGDDATDEDAFRSIADGITVKVRAAGAETAAQYLLENPPEVRKFLEWIDAILRRKHPAPAGKLVET